VSWETHLAAAVIGVLLAFAFRKLDVPPRKRYTWEEQPEEEEQEEAPIAEGADDAPPR
jgi:hypothetical protein